MAFGPIQAGIRLSIASEARGTTDVNNLSNSNSIPQDHLNVLNGWLQICSPLGGTIGITQDSKKSCSVSYHFDNPPLLVSMQEDIPPWPREFTQHLIENEIRKTIKRRLL